ncbi:hypothetical protein SAMN04488564_102388 [Lentzea waywayandensis]|uniref:DUF4241 domain-containing protein n=1 Tax=Lentzea waywayandensis TaxID=84724 RepID=A0A1I6DEI4_9PSEU|nr:hypothetical protein [Lentzea waywayandensis]SFR03781.1 hypothetical protein SAMN04488564_102388 [Lentzea waywayandensis]
MDLDVFVPELIRRNWAWADLNSPCGALPQWIERAGDLVADGEIVWSTPDDAPFGEAAHEVPPGTYPVFIGTDGYSADDGRTRYDVRVVFIALAGPEKLAAATWRHDQAGLMTVENYTWLASAKANEFVTGETFARLKDAVLSAESVHRRGPWPNEVVDPDSGLNVLLFPSYDGGSGISCIELVDEDELVGLLHFSYGI